MGLSMTRRGMWFSSLLLGAASFRPAAAFRQEGELFEGSSVSLPEVTNPVEDVFTTEDIGRDLAKFSREIPKLKKARSVSFGDVDLQTSGIPNPGGGFPHHTDEELAKMERELAKVTARLAELEEKDKHVVSRIDKWFKQSAGKLLYPWSKEQVVSFFVDNEEQKIAHKMGYAEYDGRMLYRFFCELNMTDASKLGFDNSTQWMDSKVDLWNALATKRGVLTKDEVSLKEKCPWACGDFEVEYTFGYEFTLWPLTAPWPNPIHTFVCNPLKWTPYTPSNDLGTDGSGGALSKILKGLGNWMGSMLASVAVGMANAIVTMFRCGGCGLCMMWEGFKAGLRKVWDMMKKARLWITGTATLEEKNKVWTNFARGFHDSLLETFGGHLPNDEVRKTWEDQKSQDLAHDVLLSQSELQEKMAHIEEKHKFAWEIVQGAENASYENVGRQIRNFWEPKLMAQTSEDLQQKRNMSHWSSGASSFGGQAVSLIEKKGLPPLPDEMELPDNCMEIMDPQSNVKKFRSAWLVGLNIEEPKLGEAFTHLISFEFRSALNKLTPEVLVMFIPIKKDYGQCLYAPQRLREAEAMTCSKRHRGMCLLSMKHRLFTKMVQQEWPPLAPTWRQRQNIFRGIDSSVLDTCLGEDFLFGYLRQSSKFVTPHIGQTLTPEQERKNQDYEDCRFIKDRVGAMDTDEGGQPKYSGMIWFAAMQAWIKEKNPNHGVDDSMFGARMHDRTDEPDVDPFIHQFCHSMLDCENHGTEQEMYSWSSFLKSFNGEEAADGVTETASRTTARKMWVKVIHKVRYDRLKMQIAWKRWLDFDKMFFAEDDLDGIQGLQNAYVDSIKPLMKEVLDLKINPFERPSASKPHRASVWTTNMDPPFEELTNPEETDLHYVGRKFGHWKSRWVWIGDPEESFCTEIHMVNACDDECKGCTMVGGTQSAAEMFQRHCTSHSDRWYKEKKMKACNECLEEHHTVNPLNCNREPEDEFYSVDNKVQKNANKAIVVHGFFKDYALTEKVTSKGWSSGDWKSPLRIVFIEFAESGFKRKALEMEFFSTIRDGMPCSCTCEAIKDYNEEVDCRNAIVPASPIHKSFQWCLPDDAQIPGAFCCHPHLDIHDDLELGTSSLTGDAGLEELTSKISCSLPDTFDGAVTECAQQGLELCSRPMAIGVSRFFQSYPGQRLIEKLQALDGESKLAKCISVFHDDKFRVWTMGDGSGKKKKLDKKMTKSLKNGEFMGRLQGCRARRTDKISRHLFNEARAPDVEPNSD